MIDDPSHHLNNFERENDYIYMGDQKFVKT